jgi:hypothetical protein
MLHELGENRLAEIPPSLSAIGRGTRRTTFCGVLVGENFKSQKPQFRLVPNCAH